MSVDIIIFLPLETITTLAWREGFEPSIPISRYTPLAGERIQPSSATSTYWSSRLGSNQKKHIRSVLVYLISLRKDMICGKVADGTSASCYGIYPTHIKWCGCRDSNPRPSD